MDKPTLIAMQGLPRSGKSTIVAKLSEKLGAPIVRRDAIRLAMHGPTRWIEGAEPMVKVISMYMIKSLFLSGHKVVICDETNYSKAARESLKSKDWDVVFHPVYTEPDVCKRRAILTGQHDLIPVIDGMWARRQPLEDHEPRFKHPLLGDWMEEIAAELEGDQYKRFKPNE